MPLNLIFCAIRVHSYYSIKCFKNLNLLSEFKNFQNCNKKGSTGYTDTEVETIERYMRIAEQQIRWTSNKNCIKFVRRTNQKDYVNIVNKPGCSSFIGLIGNKQDVNLGPGCLSYAVVIHELYHALGVFFLL